MRVFFGFFRIFRGFILKFLINFIESIFLYKNYNNTKYKYFKITSLIVTIYLLLYLFFEFLMIVIHFKNGHFKNGHFVEFILEKRFEN